MGKSIFLTKPVTLYESLKEKEMSLVHKKSLYSLFLAIKLNKKHSGKFSYGFDFLSLVIKL